MAVKLERRRNKNIPPVSGSFEHDITSVSNGRHDPPLAHTTPFVQLYVAYKPSHLSSFFDIQRALIDKRPEDKLMIR
jgi:hypothetical protein